MALGKWIYQSGYITFLCLWAFRLCLIVKKKVSVQVVYNIASVCIIYINYADVFLG